MVKLRYTENISLTSTSGSLAGTVWRINDLYDPNSTGAGHQSYFRDQMFALYLIGRVLWASIKITIISSAAQTPIIVTLGPNQSGGYDADTQVASERKGSKECYINGQQIKTLKCHSSSDYYFGQKKGVTLIDTSYAQLSSASVGTLNTMWYQILMKSLDTSTVTVYFKVDIEQITRFEEPQQQTSS